MSRQGPSRVSKHTGSTPATQQARHAGGMRQLGRQEAEAGSAGLNQLTHPDAGRGLPLFQHLQNFHVRGGVGRRGGRSAATAHAAATPNAVAQAASHGTATPLCCGCCGCCGGGRRRALGCRKQMLLLLLLLICCCRQPAICRPGSSCRLAAACPHVPGRGRADRQRRHHLIPACAAQWRGRREAGGTAVSVARSNTKFTEEKAGTRQTASRYRVCQGSDATATCRK